MTTIARDRASLEVVRATLVGEVAVVMTMGALHAGHVRLIRAAHAAVDRVMVTIFVNPLQFGAGEDLDRYPRTLDADLAICRAEDIDVVFVPSVAQVYPGGEPMVQVSAGALGARFEGASRPGHFDGVLTVVAKLLQLTRPTMAFFGEKDAQQLALIRRMVADLDFPVDVVGVATVREPDGLALSSRNRYLSAAGREAALSLSRALRAGADRSADGAAAVLRAASQVLAGADGVALDYLALVDDATWCDADESTSVGRLVVAGCVGATRLIDNMRINLGTHDGLKATEE